MDGKMDNVVFLKVDVDEAEDVAGEYNISAMPTFVFIKDGKKVRACVHVKSVISPQKDASNIVNCPFFEQSEWKRLSKSLHWLISFAVDAPLPRAFQIDDLMGANVDKLKELVNKHSS